MIRIAGVPITNGEAEWIADQVLRSRTLAAPSAVHQINAALESRHVIVELDADQRDAILEALDDPPDALAELRTVLLKEQVWRAREGIS